MVMRKLHVRSSGRTLVAMLLVAVAIILGGAIWRLIDAALASPDDSAAELYFTRMAYLMLVLLLITLVLLAMRGVRWFTGRFKVPSVSKPTSLDSVWEEAGRRFELPEDEDEDADEEDAGDEYYSEP